MADIFDAPAEDITSLIIYIILAFIIAIITTWANRRLWLQEVAKDQILVASIKDYKDLGIKVNILQYEAYQLISKVFLTAQNLQRQEKSNDEQLAAINEFYTAESNNLLIKVFSLKLNNTLFPEKIIYKVNSLIETYWKIFKSGKVEQFKDSKLIIKETDELFNLIRNYTSEIMKRKLKIHDIISKVPKNGYASKLEVDVGKEVEDMYNSAPNRVETD